MKGYKLYVMNEEQSRQAQERAFELGYRWLVQWQKVCNTSARLLYFHKDGDISWGESFDSFENSKLKEVSISEWLSMKKPIKPFKTKGHIVQVTRKDIEDTSIIQVEVEGNWIGLCGLDIKIKEIL